jgi:hypothetical protein
VIFEALIVVGVISFFWFGSFPFIAINENSRPKWPSELKFFLEKLARAENFSG